MKRSALLIAAMVLALVFLAPQAHATLWTLSDGGTTGTTATVDDSTSAGMNSWYVDGVNQLYQQWFWYRIGSGATAQSINTLGLQSAELYGPPSSPTKSLDLVYLGTNGLEVEITYTLKAQSDGADLGETITITNTNHTGSLDLSFFQYSDFDLNGSTALPVQHQTVHIAAGLSGDSAVQSGDGALMSETTVGPVVPNRYEAGLYADTLASLGTAGYNLNNNADAGPGDVTWAFQWDRTLGATDSFQISKDKQIHENVPEPAALFMLGGCLLVIGRKLSARLAR